jgi:hypothetical protein
MSLDLCSVPPQWKTSEIIPVPKAKIPLVINDLRPVALTSVIVKCLESIVKKHLCNKVGEMLDCMQFAYKPQRCVEDAVITLLDKICKHLDEPKRYCRVLFIDVSSAFNNHTTTYYVT